MTLSVVLILIAALPGAYLAWLALSAIGLSGVTLAIASAMLAMVIAIQWGLNFTLACGALAYLGAIGLARTLTPSTVALKR